MRIILAATIAALSALPAPAAEQLAMCYPGQRNTSDKTCIVDGDTLWLHGEDIRLKDHDTPEPQTAICGGDAEVALAHQASARFRQLLNGSDWTIERFGLDNTDWRPSELTAATWAIS